MSALKDILYILDHCELPGYDYLELLRDLEHEVSIRVSAEESLQESLAGLEIDADFDDYADDE